ncbi:CoA-acylating methylmalonate-semialdehyde dehydrogenase [Candidatus Aerophobetes bacterium]|nr:CoA-acylating methylmalonate-semialdehyde dehydrogenase [Candidatus Aerophobetes bacterium]
MMTHLEEPIKEVLILKNYIDGEWVDSKGNFHDIINPATGKIIAKAPSSSKKEVGEAISCAKNAFPEWRKTPPLARCRCLFRLKELLEENFEELSRVQTMEHGKTIDESRGETRRGIENVEVATAIPSLMMGENLEDIASGIDEYLIRQPLGIFTCIAPFNFPFMVPLWFTPYAVACGNCIIIKPSPRVPVSQVKLTELVDEAGFPPGVWNIIHGEADVATSLLESQDIKGVSFVGSTPVAKKIYQMCGQTGKRVIAQGGAKNFMVIMPDTDLDKTIPALMTSFFGNTGQRCLSGANAVCVGDDKFYKRFLDSFLSATSKIKIGYGLDETIQMGPLQSEEAKKRVLGYIEKGIQEGAKLLLDGRKPKIEGAYPANCFLGPAVFDNVTADMSIAKEEIFGPVACIMRAKSLDEAIGMIHKNPFGNAACIFTSSGASARKFQYEVECGNIGINIGIAAPMAFFPFSGMKESFFGILHGQGKEAVRFFTESKVVIGRWW